MLNMLINHPLTKEWGVHRIRRRNTYRCITIPDNNVDKVYNTLSPICVKDQRAYRLYPEQLFLERGLMVIED